MNNSLKIIKVPSDLPIYFPIKAEELVDETFGEGMFFKQTWDSATHQWLAIYNDDINDWFSGYCSAQIKQEGTLGILKTSVVDWHWRSQGVGSEMVKHRVEWLQEQGVSTIRSYAWFVDGRVPAQKMLMNNGFKPIDDIRNHWIDDHNKSFPCAVCGSVCKCVARIFEYKG